MSPGAERQTHDSDGRSAISILAALREVGSVDIPVREIPDDAAAWADGIRAAATAAGLNIVFLQDNKQVTIVDAEH
jgi:hypothetical protein